MGISNFERMLQLADDVFAVKNDPDQLDVNPDVLDQLRRIHPATVSDLMTVMAQSHGSCSYLPRSG